MAYTEAKQIVEENNLWKEVYKKISSSKKNSYNEYSLGTYPDTIISRDNCLMKLAKTDNYLEAWNTVDQDEVNKLFEKTLKEVIDKKIDFVVDMTNMNVKSRRKFTQRLKNRYNLDCVVFITDYNELLRRNENRTGKVLDKKIITNMCKRFQMPYPGEGFRNIEYVF